MRITRFGSSLLGALLTVLVPAAAFAAGTWSLTGSMSTARHAHTATLLPDGRVLVSGGTGNLTPISCCFQASAEIYDPALGTWSLTGSMSTARQNHTATLLPSGRVLVSGGYNGNGRSTVASAEIYDPALGTWSLTGSMSTARQIHTATLLPDGRVLVSGGYNGGSTVASAEIYDPALGTWSPTGSMSTSRRFHTATLLPDSRVLVSGGFDGSSYLASAEIYDPALGTWSLTGSMSTAREKHTATLLPDGRVLVSGGFNGGSSVASAEIYDPALGTWSLTGSMSTARENHTATLLPDGRVLAAGGNDGSSNWASAEIYDPATGTWSLTGSMSTARIYYWATLLSDGGVLVSGGYDGGSLASAEVFDATPPQVSCDEADGAWHNSDVTIACTASDPESALANAADASFNLTTNVPIGTETANAATNSYQVCNAGGDCTTAGPITGNKVDKKPPTITITSPAANATYQLNAIVGASYACGDGGSGVASCQGPVANASPIDTSSTGTKTFTVTSTDNVGNPSTLTVTYNVVSGGGGGTMAADVGITLSAPSKVSPGGTLTYSMTVTNAGKLTASGVVVSDAIPAGTVFASASSSQGTVTAPAVGSNGTVTVNLGSLAKGATATISVAVTVTAAPGTVLTNTATVTATTQDLNSSNNSATKKTTVRN